MFNNIGRKLQALAKVVCWLGIILSVIIGIISVVNGFQINGRYYGNHGTPMIITGFLYIILGSLFSWIGSWAMCGLGVAAERAEQRMLLGAAPADKSEF